jgi:BlaI family penicillinase repressor
MKISGAESVVMEALWKRAPSNSSMTAEEIGAEVAQGQGWTEATVKTLINRLLKKKALAATRDGRRFLYRPLVARAAYVQAESQGLLDRLFDGRLAPMVSHLSQSRSLTPEDIAELKRLIAEMDR